MSLQIETQSSIELVSPGDVKDLLRLDTTADDISLARLAKAARQYAERVTHRSLIYKGYVYYMDRFPISGYYMDHTEVAPHFNRRLPDESSIRIPAPPLIAVDSILYLDPSLVQQTWDPSQYYVSTTQEPGVVLARPGCVYPVVGCVPNAVEIHFHAGYYYGGYGMASKPIDETLRLAIMQLAAHWYDHPETVTPDAVHEVPSNLNALLQGYKIYV